MVNLCLLYPWTKRKYLTTDQFMVSGKIYIIICLLTGIVIGNLISVIFYYSCYRHISKQGLNLYTYRPDNINDKNACLVKLMSAG